MSWVPGGTALLAAMLLGLLCSCTAERGAECDVRGVVVDVQDGEPLVGIRVEGPEGTRAVTDPHGRFILKGLVEGEGGLVRASRSDGWEAEVSLRPLREGGVSIVLHLAPCRAEAGPTDFGKKT